MKHILPFLMILKDNSMICLVNLDELQDDETLLVDDLVVKDE
jgi:hypothetical protein